MTTSNKILLVSGSLLAVLYLLLLLSYKPEYRRSAIRNVADKYPVVVIQDETIKSSDVVFTEALSREESYIYYKKEDFTTKTWLRTSNDTLFIMRPPLIKPETPLHLHLKGVDEVVLTDEVIYKR